MPWGRYRMQQKVRLLVAWFHPRGRAPDILVLEMSQASCGGGRAGGPRQTLQAAAEGVRAAEASGSVMADPDSWILPVLGMRWWSPQLSGFRHRIPGFQVIARNPRGGEVGSDDTPLMGGHR